MADLESTTPKVSDVQSSAPSSSTAPAKFESRLLKVGDFTPSTRLRPGSPIRFSNEPTTPMSFLRLQGRWLGEAGFPIGTKVRVNVEKGRLIIEALPNFPEREPRLPRRAEKLFF